MAGARSTWSRASAPGSLKAGKQRAPLPCPFLPLAEKDGTRRARKGKGMVTRTLTLGWMLLWLTGVNVDVRDAAAVPLEGYATAIATADRQHQALE
jgi:hypothetical protein